MLALFKFELLKDCFTLCFQLLGFPMTEFRLLIRGRLYSTNVIKSTVTLVPMLHTKAPSSESLGIEPGTFQSRTDSLCHCAILSTYVKLKR